MAQFPCAHVLAVTAAALLQINCGDGGSPAQPTPLIYTFSFASEPQTFRPYSMWLEDAREGVVNQVAVAVIAEFGQDCRVDRLRGTLIYDAGVLRIEDHTVGPFMRQGGLEAQTIVTYGPGNVTFQFDRPGTVDGASGGGTVITLRFRSAGPYSRGASSPLQWWNAHAYAANFVECLHDTRDADVSVR